MPSLELIVAPPDVRNLATDGNLLLDPPLPGLPRVLLRRLVCWLRVPPLSGAFTAVIDPGAPLTVIPHNVWNLRYGWRAGQDYDELTIAGIGTILRGQILTHNFSCRLARLRVEVELAGQDPKGNRIRIDSLICQLADVGGPPYIILGLWGGVFTGRRLAVDQQAGSDDLTARLEY